MSPYLQGCSMYTTETKNVNIVFDLFCLLQRSCFEILEGKVFFFFHVWLIRLYKTWLGIEIVATFYTFAFQMLLLFGPSSAVDHKKLKIPATGCN